MRGAGSATCVPLRGNGECVSRDMAMTPCTTPPYLKQVGDRMNERDGASAWTALRLQVPERFPMAPAPKQSAPASSVADNRVRPCTHVKSLKGGWEVVELTPSAF